MTSSKQLAGLIGPTLVALSITEALNMKMFASQIAPVVYLDGTLLFIAGLALIRAHNRWTWNWPLLITVAGWVLLLGGLYRMIAPGAPQATANVGSYAMLSAIGLIGAYLTYKGTGPDAAEPPIQN